MKLADTAIMTDEGITLQVVLDHMQAHRNDLSGQMTSMKSELNNRIDQLDKKLSTRIDDVQFILTNQINALDDRLNSIEIAIVEQKHEERIQRLEKVTGLTTKL
jgi:DNA-binding transcriptional MerR regulator